MQTASKMQFGIKTAIKSTQSYASLLEVEDIKKKLPNPRLKGIYSLKRKT